MSTEQERWPVKGDLLLSLRVSQALGVAPVRFESTRSGTFVYYSRAHRYYGVFLLTVLNVSRAYLICYGYGWFVETPEEYLFFLLYSANEMLSALPLVFCAFGCSERLEILLKCADNIEKINKSISPNDISTSRYTSTVLAGFALWTPAAMQYGSYYGVAVHIVAIAERGMMLAMNLQFLNIVRSINAVLENINRALSDLLPDVHQESMRNEHITTNDNRLPVRRKLQISQKLRQLTSGYAAAVGAAGELNDVFGVPMFFQLAAFTTQLTMLMYMWIKVSREYETDTLEEWFYSFIYQYAWIAYEVTHMFLIVEPCHTTQQTLLHMRLLVGEIAAFSYDVILDATEPFINLLLNRFSYSAMGIFTLGRPVVFTIIGGAIAIISLII